MYKNTYNKIKNTFLIIIFNYKIKYSLQKFVAFVITIFTNFHIILFVNKNFICYNFCVRII